MRKRLQNINKRSEPSILAQEGFKRGLNCVVNKLHMELRKVGGFKATVYWHELELKVLRENKNCKILRRLMYKD